MEKDKHQYTLADLQAAMKDLGDAQGEYNEAMRGVKTASDALKSHQHEADKKDQVVQQRKATIRNILNNLEKF